MSKKLNLNDFIIYENLTIAHALKLLNISANKCLCVLDRQNKFLGTISDGDIRKYIIKDNDLSNIDLNVIFDLNHPISHTSSIISFISSLL